jgi:hypothetical protein
LRGDALNLDPPVKSILKLTAVLVAAVIFFLLVTLPSRPAPAAWHGDPSVAARTAAGAYHVHTSRSDGAADRAAVAAAAARAGLAFVIFTDHGDGTRAPEAPAYLSGVLCIDGVEISTNGGHYVALGLAQTPYPLGGEAWSVIEDVERLGGFGFAAHPGSPRAELAWRDWSLPVDGVEWLNADSEWRDETRAALARTLFAYLLRPGPALAAMLDRPSTLDRWDGLTAKRSVAGIAGHDAHGGIGRGAEDAGWRGVPMPSYESSFRSFSTRVVLEAPLAGNAAGDATAVLEAIRAGRMFTAIDAIAGPALLDFQGWERRGNQRDAAVRVPMGGVLAPGPAAVSVQASMPPDAELVVVQSTPDDVGREIARTATPAIATDVEAPGGAIRIEVRVRRAPGDPQVPWLVSNPIYVRPGPARAVAPATPAALTPLAAEWHVERGSASTGAVGAEDGVVRLDFQLGAGEPSSPFVAAAADLPTGLPPGEALVFTIRASRPMRVSAQLRYPQDGGQRWGRSVYADDHPRQVRIPLDGLFAMDGQSGPAPPLQSARSLLFVVDLTNARPGDAGTVEISGLGTEAR